MNRDVTAHNPFDLSLWSYSRQINQTEGGREWGLKSSSSLLAIQSISIGFDLSEKNLYNLGVVMSGIVAHRPQFLIMEDFRGGSRESTLQC